jgi:hypothetical protein
MPWDLPQDFMNESTGMLEGITTWSYNVTQGTFWSMLLACFCIVMYISSIKHGQERAVGFASISGLLGSLFLVTLGLMSWWIASIFIIIGAIGITYMIMNR